jgi:sugar transferase EpsL
MSFYQKFGKRAFDLVGAFLALIVGSPLLLVVALLVRITLGSPVIFQQMRPGRHGQLFIIFKFRSMNDAKDPSGRLLPDTDRLTRVGRFLRATSIDELPELANVIRGDMSFVGPRPLLVEYLPYYTLEQAARHDVRPGITGWAQVNGRQDISFSERFKLDVWYVDHCSFGLDLKIILATFFQAARGAGIRSGQNVSEVDDLGFSKRHVRSDD